MIVAVSVAPLPAALPRVTGTGIDSSIAGDPRGAGVFTHMVTERSRSLPRTARLSRTGPTVLVEYKVVAECGQNVPGALRKAVCASRPDVCKWDARARNGTFGWVFRRVAKAGQPANQGWGAPIGATCFDSQAPVGAEGLSMDALAAAFARTPFAKPQAVMQPVGNRTLVGLPTYFQVSWPQQGFGPGEVNALNLVGVPVRIRPVLVHHVYDFGDGTTSGPTQSSGGPWPDGDITHTYERKGVVNPKITSTFTGEASLDGGATWFPVPGTASVTGPVQPLAVLTAKNRLVNR